jgi:hypothetical protein
MVRAHRHRRSAAIGRRVQGLAFAALATVAVVATLGPVPAHAEDRVASLNQMLGSSSEKTRLSAVLALAKLGEPEVDKPLIRALGDPSPKVRGVAAAVLGGIDTGAALPLLRTLAQSDADPDVRKSANAAAMKIAAGHPGGRDPKPDSDAFARRSALGAERPARAAYATLARPELYVRINSSTDESPGTADPASRRLHADTVKRALLDQLHSETSITAVTSDAERGSLDTRHLDLSVTRLAATRAGDVIEIGADLRIAISDDHGKMLSILSGGAKVQVPAGKFDAKYLPVLRKEALDNAMRGMFRKLVAQLRGD